MTNEELLDKIMYTQNPTVTILERGEYRAEILQRILELTTQRNLAREARGNWKKRAETAEARLAASQPGASLQRI